MKINIQQDTYDDGITRTIYITYDSEKIENARQVALDIAGFDAAVEHFRELFNSMEGILLKNSYSENWCYIMHDTLHCQFTSRPVKISDAVLAKHPRITKW